MIDVADVHRVLVALVAQLARKGADPAMIRTALSATLVHVCHYASGDATLARHDVELALEVIGGRIAEREGLAPPKGEPS